MKKFFAAVVLASVSIVLISNGENMAGDKEKGDKEKKPEFSIKEVMKKAHVSKLCGKVATGKASEEEKKELVGYYLALHAAVPPKGEAKEWKTMTKEMLDAAKDVLDGKEGAGKKLAASIDCKGCHGKFKG